VPVDTVSPHDPLLLSVSQQLALRPTLQSLGVTQAQLDQQPEHVIDYYCDALVDFFCEPDADEISPWLRITQYLTQAVADEKDADGLIDAVLTQPDGAERGTPLAYVIWHHGSLALALTRGADRVWVYSLPRGLEMLETLPLANAERLEHDAFEGWVLSALDVAVQRIHLIDLQSVATIEPLDRQLAWATRLGDLFRQDTEQDALRDELAHQLPAWLRNAPPSGRLAYSKWVLAMARACRKYRGQRLVDQVPGDGPSPLFARLLALQLRRVALEYSLQGREGMTERGYRRVRAAVRTYASQRLEQGEPMLFRPLSDGQGFVIGPTEGGPWVLLRPWTMPLLQQVDTPVAAGSPLADPFARLYQDFVVQRADAALFEEPLHTLARLKQVGGNLLQAAEPDNPESWRRDVNLLRNLALLLIYPGARHSSPSLAAHPRIKRLDTDWAGARQQLSRLQLQRLRALRRPVSSAQVEAGLHRVDGGLIYNKDENHFNVLSNIRLGPLLNVDVVEYQVVDDPQRPVNRGPYLTRDAHGQWEIERRPRLRRDLEGLSVTARKAMNTGTALAATQPAILAHANRDAQATGMLPVLVEESLERSAQQFEEAAATLERYTQTRHTEASIALVRKLREEASQLRVRGQALRIEMIRLTCTPNMGDLTYLLGQNLIRIRRLNGRVEETIDGARDYLQEFEVLDLSNGETPLWYAHFHYPALDTGDDYPSAAHLKTVAQRRLGREYERQAGIKVHRGPISNAAARQPFLSAPR